MDFLVEKQVLLDETDKPSIQKWESWLKDQLTWFGEPISNRDAWSFQVPAQDRQEIIEEAERLLHTPEVVITKELYTRFTRMGDRQVCDKAFGDSTHRLYTFALAECIEDKGRFLPPLIRSIWARCAFPTWVLTAHDYENVNYYGRRITIDLGASTFGWSLALVYRILEDRLPGDVRTLILENLDRRIFTPYEEMISGQTESMWWFFTTNNWGAVCLGAVTAAALAIIEDKNRRARYAAVWEKYIRNFLKGFPEDGYCTEGLSYWSYGYSHYLYAAEALRQATDGQFDAMADPRNQRIAQFPLRMGLCRDVYPCIADCKIGYVPEANPLRYVCTRLGLDRPNPEHDYSRPYAALMHWFDHYSDAPVYHAAKADPQFELRSWFPDAGLLICRPGDGDESKLAVCLKGGNNREHHNHNDVGSFSCASGGVQLISDIGHEYYCARTFSEHRYESPFYGSYGHSVPLPAGLEQKPQGFEPDTSKLYGAAIIEQSFSPEQDRLVLDLSPVYDDEKIQKLNRSFLYTRCNQPSLTIEDEFIFRQEEPFETAVMTYGCCTIDGNRVIIKRKGCEMEAAFSCNHPLELSVEPIHGDIAYWKDSFAGETPSRIRCAVKGKALSGKMVCTIRFLS